MEKELLDDDFIISKTDIKGNITYVNDVFLNIINANECEVMNKPHNIVRHPDMPKAVFKFMWSELKQQREVFAFVKNKTFDNGYYWVFANISPSYDTNKNIIGYYSVRRKINEKAKQIISDLYKKMCDLEKIQDMNASWELVKKELKDKEYNEFILKLQGLK